MNITLREEREALVAKHMDVEERGLVDEVIATFSQPRYDIVPTNTIFDGADRVRQRILALAAAMPGCHIEAVKLHHADDAVIVETRTRGIHSAPLLGVAPTGRPYDIRGVAIFRFEDANMIEETVYYDRQTLIDQLNPP